MPVIACRLVVRCCGGPRLKQEESEIIKIARVRARFLLFIVYRSIFLSSLPNHQPPMYTRRLHTFIIINNNNTAAAVPSTPIHSFSYDTPPNPIRRPSGPLEQRARDDEAHDLVRPLQDLVHAGIPQVALHVIVLVWWLEVCWSGMLVVLSEAAMNRLCVCAIIT